MAAKDSVPVVIQGREYKVKGETDLDTVRRAAALLDETMNRLRGRAGTADSVGIAVLAGLNLANHLVVMRDEANQGAVLEESRLDDLLELVEAAVAEASA